MELDFNKKITLLNNVQIPVLGFGTYKITEDCAGAVERAIDCGYRLIDTAAMYGNESAVAKGIAASGIGRENIFITTKVWNNKRGYNSTISAFKASLRALKTDYIDLYLIHWPANKMQFGAEADSINADTWRALETLYMQRKVRAIGVCNFLTHHLIKLKETAMINPMVNQIELHPGFMRDELISYCKQQRMAVEAWSPLSRGEILDNPDLIRIATIHGKTPAQIVLNYLLTKGVIPLPKTVSQDRMAQNSQVFDFDLTEEEIQTLDNFPSHPGKNPDEVTF